MQTATRKNPGRIAEPDNDASPADAWEAPSGSSIVQGYEERRSELDECILAGLVRA